MSTAVYTLTDPPSDRPTPPTSASEFFETTDRHSCRMADAAHELADAVS